MSDSDELRPPLDEDAIDLLWRDARTQNAWTDAPVSDELLQQIHETMKWGPTSGNGWPLRVVYVRSPDEKERLAATAMESNAEKIRQAPVTAILAYDLRFFEEMDRLFPHDPSLAEFFASDDDVAEITAFRNATLQAGYFILAARAVGLDCGPMSGFSNDEVDELYFADTSVRSNILCSLGIGDPEGLFERHPRPTFDQISRIV